LGNNRAPQEAPLPPVVVTPDVAAPPVPEISQANPSVIGQTNVAAATPSSPAPPAPKLSQQRRPTPVYRRPIVPHSRVVRPAPAAARANGPAQAIPDRLSVTPDNNAPKDDILKRMEANPYKRGE
jgi:hypothetical protein